MAEKQKVRNITELYRKSLFELNKKGNKTYWNIKNPFDLRLLRTNTNERIQSVMDWRERGGEKEKKIGIETPKELQKKLSMILA